MMGHSLVPMNLFLATILILIGMALCAVTHSTLKLWEQLEIFIMELSPLQQTCLFNLFFLLSKTVEGCQVGPTIVSHTNFNFLALMMEV
jgi:hypothetical protein